MKKKEEPKTETKEEAGQPELNEFGRTEEEQHAHDVQSDALDMALAAGD